MSKDKEEEVVVDALVKEVITPEVEEVVEPEPKEVEEKPKKKAKKEKAPEPVIKTINVCGQKVEGTVLNGKITDKDGVTYDC